MSERLDALLIIPGNMQQIYQALARCHAIEPPAKARFIAAYLMRRNCSVDLIDANVAGFNPVAIGDAVKVLNPHLVVIPVYGFNPSSSTQNMPAARALAKVIKDTCPKIPIIMMGTHPAGIPIKTLEDEPIDFVCSGEGPITVYELLQAIKSGSKMEDIEKVRSLWCWKDGVIQYTKPAPLIDLNNEPALMGWTLMDPRKYYAHDWHTFWADYENRTPYANPYSREGCPFHCGFCNIQTTYRDGEKKLIQLGKLKPGVNSFRTLRPELFLDEVTYLVETFGVKHFKIPDEMFGLGDHPVKVFTLIKERFDDSLNFWAYFRADTLKPKDCELFRSGGLRWTPVGIEAANSKVRSGQDKKFTDEYVYKLIEQLKIHDISVALNYIFGLPGDTIETMQETYNMAVELNGPFANFYCNQALPMSEQYQAAKTAGYPLPERPGGPGWIGHAQYSYESEPFYMGSSLTPAQVLKFRDEAHIRYYTRPEYRNMMLADPHFGKTALKNVDEWVKDIKALKRSLLEKS